MSRRLTLLLSIAVCMALLLAAQNSSPLVVDFIVRAIELIAKAPFLLLFVVVLLLLTAGAGAWATFVGIRTHKRTRVGKRHRLHF